MAQSDELTFGDFTPDEVSEIKKLSQMIQSQFTGESHVDLAATEAPNENF